MKNILLFILFLCPFVTKTQDENIKHQDYIYKDFIKSVKFSLNGLQLSYPIIDMQSSSTLMLSFDDMDADVKDYSYTFTHYNADWTPSDLSDSEYIDGYTDETIDEYNYSFSTLASFTHYDLIIPNEDMTWTKSGNYLLKVYIEDDEKTLAITRRFMVVDNQVQVVPNPVGPAFVSKIKTHHEIDFKVIDREEMVRSPRTEIRAAILQNGRWDNAITDIEPFVIKGKEIVFDYQDKIVFPAGREFRYVDLRSFRYENHGIQEIEEYEDGYVITLLPEKKRQNQVYLRHLDANGQFLIENIDFQRDHDLRSDYADVYFQLYSPQPIYETEVYLFGAMTDWQILPRYKMVYNDEITSYVGKFELKQGRYDYLYAAVPKGKEVPMFDETEGSWYEASNDYSILIYYRPFGTRYDQLISAYTLDIPTR